MKEALFYQKLDHNMVKCDLCSHRCTIPDQKRGLCGVRENHQGTLITLVYGKLISRAVDPIEKKPLYHFLPGSQAYSIASVGCNFRCDNCQNWEISQTPKPQKPIMGYEATPEIIVKAAKKRGCRSIAYTYTEPTVYMEYAFDTSKLAVKEDLRNVFVTNGYITKEALSQMKPYLHAANIDLKSSSNEVYRKNCGARLEPVLEAIKLYKKLGIWIEITTLVIPGLNDSTEDLQGVAEFISSVGKDIPWHISRFYPSYKLIDTPPTPLETIRRARNIGLQAGLLYVYQGNIPGEGEYTICPYCGELLIERYGYIVTKNNLVESNCPRCNGKIVGIWE